MKNNKKGEKYLSHTETHSLIHTHTHSHKHTHTYTLSHTEHAFYSISVSHLQRTLSEECI